MDNTFFNFFFILMTEKTSLRALNLELVALMEKAEEAAIADAEKADGTVSFDLGAEIDALMERVDGKINNVIDYMFHLTGDITAIDAKIKHLQEVKKTKAKRIASIEAYLKRVMDFQNVIEMDTGEHLLKLKKNPAALEIVDATKIPKTFYNFSMVTKVSNLTHEELEKYKALTAENPKEGVEHVFNEEIDNAMIKDALKAGEEVPGAQLTNAIRLEIK